MIPAFRLHRPTDLGAATALLAALGDGARLYAGGTELLLVLREGMLEADDLVDLKRIAGLADIGVDPAAAVLRIGALATHTQVAESEVVRERLPAFAAAEAALANRRVRNVG
ncbi:MAG TPA: FAD binding domain-containing protein, partial [Candidatus Limnocylindrales bacterium]|nr:FAD binding domain-containing protein [Candidatus Limnocylindrales bacterium]